MTYTVDKTREDAELNVESTLFVDSVWFLLDNHKTLQKFITTSKLSNKPKAKIHSYQQTPNKPTKSQGCDNKSWIKP